MWKGGTVTRGRSKSKTVQFADLTVTAFTLKPMRSRVQLVAMVLAILFLTVSFSDGTCTQACALCSLPATHSVAESGSARAMPPCHGMKMTGRFAGVANHACKGGTSGVCAHRSRPQAAAFEVRVRPAALLQIESICFPISHTSGATSSKIVRPPRTHFDPVVSALRI
jgi:hypothetical protein